MNYMKDVIDKIDFSTVTGARFLEIMKDIEYRCTISGDDSLYEYDSHEAADEVMCRILEISGYSEGITIYRKLHKWYE